MADELCRQSVPQLSTRGYRLHRLILRIDGTGHDTIDNLREFLGGRFVSLVVIPEGMAFRQVEVRFHSGTVA